MDIVDTFNHLIPTEHLDDALFLGSNLENEVCEDFSTSQNVLEDSLKNMLSDKDPMLGSASAQFCLPVLDSNDPNFQMPCSTVIGLDDIMDEEEVKESGNDTIDEDELVLPNRNLRSRCEETSVTSPRKSPRLMAQEPVRSLRQSTLAKRSNVAPLVSTKKSSVKSGSAPKTGQKQERSPAKEVDVAAPLKIEQPKEVRRSTRRSGQTEGTAAAVTASQSNTKCLPGPEEVNEIKSETLNQAKVEETSQVLSCANLAGACSPSPGETKDITEVSTKTESGKVESVCSVSADTEITAVKNEANDVIDSMGSETSSEEKTDQTEESEKKAEEHDQSGVPGKANDSSSVSVNPCEICETISNLSSPIEKGVDCSLGSHNVEISEENTLSVTECVTEPVDDDKGVEKTVTSCEKLLDSTEFDNKDLKSEEFTSADPGNSILDSSVLDQKSQNVQQISSTKVEGPEASKFQDDDKQISVSSKCEKNIRPRHSKSVIQNKQNLTAGTRQKSGAAQQEITRSKTRAGLTVSGLHSPSSASLKRNADEQESHQHPNNPVKIRKKQSDLDLKARSCVSGASGKKQTNMMLKKIPRVQASGQVHKSSIQKASEKSPTHQSSSRDTHHSVHPLSGHVSNLGQKAPGQKHQLATALKTNSSAKEEAEPKDPPVTEHLKEDDKEKNKSKRIDKNLQPRQRRSSKSLSLDEPPLFIPDNISTVKREGLEHTSASESKSIWVPNKQCGFCKKPHGNRFMVGCGRCDDWFHGDCVGLSLSQAQQMGEEDKEYVCVKCCAEEDKKMECFDQSVPDTQVKLEIHREEKATECEKPGMSKPIPTCNINVTTEKTKQTEDAGKHKVKIFRRESGDGKNLSESRDSDTKKGQHVPARKGSQTAVIPRRSPDDKNEKISKESLNVVEKSMKSGVHEKQEIKKKKNEKGSVSATHLPAVPASKPSADQIRQSVKQSLKEILMKRLTDSTLKIPEERAAKVATRIERELFSFFRDTDSKYKNKYRSLMFNLKDPKNKILFKKVLKGEVTPDHLIKMSPEELASKELAAWRQRENRHTIEMIEKEQREVERRPITKITHKGEIEIESETPMKEQEEVMEIQEPNMKSEKSEEAEKEVNESASPDTTSQHKNHLFDLNCKICIGRMAPPTDDPSAKKVKVSVGVARKQSDNEAESIADALSSTSSILASELLDDDKQDSSKSSFTPLPKSETPGTVECESLFLARLNFIWKGFINMPSVANELILSSIDIDATGDWECLVNNSYGNSTKQVEIVVLEMAAPYCPAERVINNKGDFRWPKTLAGITAYHPCLQYSFNSIAFHNGAEESKAWRKCNRTGRWDEENYSACPYSQEVTQVLHAFSQMHINLTTVLEFSRQLTAYTRGASHFVDKMDVIYLAYIMEKLIVFVDEVEDIGDALIEIASNVMLVDDHVLWMAQKEDKACTRIVRCVEHIASQTLTSNIQAISKVSQNIALEAFMIKPSSFTGMTCTAFQKISANSDKSVMRDSGSWEANNHPDHNLNFKCNTGNLIGSLMSSSTRNAVAVASVHLPQSVFSQSSAWQSVDNSTCKLQFIVFRNGKLFPSTGNSSNLADDGKRRTVATPAVFAKIDGCSFGNLTSPLTIGLRHFARGIDPIAAFWDFDLLDGHGGWWGEGCHIISSAGNITTVQSTHFSNFAVLMDFKTVLSFPQYPGEFLHPVVYACTAVMLLCLFASIITYIVHHSTIRISRKGWHMLLNFCFHTALTFAVFAGGINRIKYPIICQAVGIVLHYSTLSTMLWIGVTARNIYKQVTKKPQPCQNSDQPSYPKQPLLRFYLISGGVPFIICGITAATNINNYGIEGNAPYCWMAWEPSLGAFYGPVAFIVLVTCVYFLCTYVQLKRHPERKYELKEKTEDPQRIPSTEVGHGHIADSVSVPHASCSMISSSLLENEHSFKAQLRAAAFTLFLFTATWTFGALAVSQGHFLDMIFSCLYGAFCVTLGLFILIHHCAKRDDVWHCWWSCCPSRRNTYSVQVNVRPKVNINGDTQVHAPCLQESPCPNKSAVFNHPVASHCKLTNLHAVQNHVNCLSPVTPCCAKMHCDQLLDDEAHIHVHNEGTFRPNMHIHRCLKSRTKPRYFSRHRSAGEREYAYHIPSSIDGSIHSSHTDSPHSTHDSQSGHRRACCSKSDPYPTVNQPESSDASTVIYSCAKMPESDTVHHPAHFEMHPRTQSLPFNTTSHNGILKGNVHEAMIYSSDSTGNIKTGPWKNETTV